MRGEGSPCLVIGVVPLEVGQTVVEKTGHLVLVPDANQGGYSLKGWVDETEGAMGNVQPREEQRGLREGCTCDGSSA